MKNKKRKNPMAEAEQSAVAVTGQPEDAYELLHKFGTYNIQPTAEADNLFPVIAQGLPKDEEERKQKK